MIQYIRLYSQIGILILSIVVLFSAMVHFIDHNQSEQIWKANKLMLSEKLYKEFDEEMQLIGPSFKYCLASKKDYKPKDGASSLRSGRNSSVSQTTETKDNAKLEKHAAAIYEWMDVKKVSRIRMVMNWQAAGGLSFVTATHHRATQCFRYVGNMKHDENKKEVSLEEFQDCIRVRHAVGSTGMERDKGDGVSIDYEK